MRTTVMLPPELLRAAKARSAERGESLKDFLTRAVAAELAMSAAGTRVAPRVRLPLFGDPNAPKVHLTNRDLARALADADAEEFAASGGRTRSRRTRARR